LDDLAGDDEDDDLEDLEADEDQWPPGAEAGKGLLQSGLITEELPEPFPPKEAD